MANQEQPRILVLDSSAGNSKIRVRPFLNALESAGLIAGYCCYDRDLHGLGPHEFRDFTHIFAHKNLSHRQFRWLTREKRPFIYEIDDYLVGPLKPAGKKGKREIERVVWCLENATTIVTPSPRLAANLQDSTGSDFSSRFLLLENGLIPTKSQAPRKNSGPAQTLIWVSSYLPRIEEEAPGLIRAIADSAKAANLATLLVGEFPEDIISTFEPVTHIPPMPFENYRRFLSSQKNSIAIAPLPLTQSSPQKCWYESKSDVKLVEFHGHGIPGIFSASPPYRDSDIAPVMLVKNNLEEWRRAIKFLAATPWSGLSQKEVETIHTRRSYQHLARRFYEHALVDKGDKIVMDMRPSKKIFRKMEMRLRRIWKRKRR